MLSGMDTSAPLAVTNRRIGQDIGMGHSGVSRIRSGERLPSVTVMSRIARVYKWQLEDQVRARLDNRYAEEWERVLREYYGPASGDAS